MTTTPKTLPQADLIRLLETAQPGPNGLIHVPGTQSYIGSKVSDRIQASRATEASRSNIIAASKAN